MRQAALQRAEGSQGPASRRGSSVPLPLAQPSSVLRRLLLTLPRTLLALLLALLLTRCGAARSSSPPVAGVTVGAACVQGQCAEGLICHHAEPGVAPGGRCQLQVGRCRSDWDCAHGGAQRCRRLGPALGVCQDAGL